MTPSLEPTTPNNTTSLFEYYDHNSNNDTGDMSGDFTTHSYEEDPDSLALIKDHVMFYITVTFTVSIGIGVNILGSITNIINIVVFIKTGFKDSITISLFALAISDFGSCFSMIFPSIAINPWFQNVGGSIGWVEVQYLIGCWPHVGFTKVTTLITALVTFERCLCVSVPLKVKTLVTRQRVVAYLVSSFVIVFGCMIPIFYSNRLGGRFDANLNKTILGLVFTPDRQAIENVIFIMPYASISMFAYIFIIISTVVLVVKLMEKSKWRASATATTAVKTDNNEAATKEQKISKMVATLSTLFIVCFFPTTGMQIMVWVDRRTNIDGIYSNLNRVMSYFTFTLESLNSAVNIFVYYNNSSNYKTVFDRIFFSKSKTTTSTQIQNTRSIQNTVEPTL